MSKCNFEAPTYKQHLEDIIWDRLVKEAKLEIINDCLINGKFKLNENGEVIWNGKKPEVTHFFADDPKKPYVTLEGATDALNNV
ncbi:hypothetical protein [Herbiconiux daphne]|uniref:Uncharacterized protein n=1 Tax=Herbiconiux daphne TaxID=2970914 RepID=A0ABT2HB64_9MICO|nr:hypothetical protein [Herbiconiux daphne]MCS5737112.1 hypothetical protein [Herbiconiux daphne]